MNLLFLDRESILGWGGRFHIAYKRLLFLVVTRDVLQERIIISSQQVDQVKLTELDGRVGLLN